MMTMIMMMMMMMTMMVMITMITMMMMMIVVLYPSDGRPVDLAAICLVSPPTNSHLLHYVQFNTHIHIYALVVQPSFKSTQQ